MHPVPGLNEFVANFLVVISASVAVLLASHFLRLRPIVGFLLTGMLIGRSYGWEHEERWTPGMLEERPHTEC